MSKRFVYMSAACLAAAMVWLGTSAPTAQAIPPFKDAFYKEYVKADSDDPKDKAFAKAADAAKCDICHAGKNKKVRNDYGKAYGKFASKADKGNAQKLTDAFKKAAKEHTVADDTTSPTFGDKIADGKLPFEKK